MFTQNLYIHVESSFIIAPNWKPLKCPSTYEWINTLWYIHTMDYHSAILKKQRAKIHKDNDESPMSYANWKKPDSKGFVQGLEDTVGEGEAKTK